MKLTAYSAANFIIHESHDHPILVMVIGLPGSGKSTFLNQLNNLSENDFMVASTDDYIEREGAKLGLNYSQAFKAISFKDANAHMKTIVNAAFADKRNIAFDQTNVSSKKRKTTLDQAPTEYFKIGVIMNVPDRELQARLAKREAETGKSIPYHVMSSMTSSWQTPSKSEGFDVLITVSE